MRLFFRKAVPHVLKIHFLKCGIRCSSAIVIRTGFPGCHTFLSSFSVSVRLESWSVSCQSLEFSCGNTNDLHTSEGRDCCKCMYTHATNRMSHTAMHPHHFPSKGYVYAHTSVTSCCFTYVHAI